MRDQLPRRLQLMMVAAAAAGTILYAAVWPIAGRSATAPTGAAAPRSGREAGVFKPTPEEWAGFKTEQVATRIFRPEEIAEGNIAIDDDLTTPVFSPYSGRVVRVMARLGDAVAKDGPLL